MNHVCLDIGTAVSAASSTTDQHRLGLGVAERKRRPVYHFYDRICIVYKKGIRWGGGEGRGKGVRELR